MKTYPLNLLSLASFVRERSSHDASIVDGEILSLDSDGPLGGRGVDPERVIHENIPRMIAAVSDPSRQVWVELERRILSHRPDAIGISCVSGNLDAARTLVSRLRCASIPLILGGSHPTALPAQSLVYTGADYAVVGEGEIPLINLLDALTRGDPPQTVLSTAMRKGGELYVSPRGRLLPDVNDLPIPDRDILEFPEEYFGDAIMTGRGCPHRCAYCASKTIWGGRVRLRSVESIMEELRTLAAKRFPEPASVDVSFPLREPPTVKALDDTFTLDRKRTLALLESIIREGLNKFEFTGGVRADTLDEELAFKMREAGFRRVTLGVESGSPRILRQIRKGESNDEVIRAIGLLRKAGIYSHAFFMIGFPGETPEDIELSKELILNARPDHVEVNMVTPYPGTELFPALIGHDAFAVKDWFRWFHQGLSTHSTRLGYDLDRAYEDFLQFAADYHSRVSDGAT
jgi:radical SAM superfamily enzyme YgiQ (UPF0313 family)